MTVAYLVAGVRTPIGRYAGALAGVRPDDLAAHVIRELVARHPSVDWARVDDVVLGCANQAGEDNRNVARMAALLGRPARGGAGQHGQPALRLRPGRARHRRPVRSSPGRPTWWSPAGWRA